MLTANGDSDGTVQAGTPMTVTGEGPLVPVREQGAAFVPYDFFCFQISSGVRGQTAPGRAAGPEASR